MDIWIILFILFLILQSVFARQPKRLKRPIKLPFRPVTRPETPFDNVSQEFAAEGPQPSRDYGEYSMDGKTSETPFGETSMDGNSTETSFGETSMGRESAKTGADVSSVPIFTEGRILDDSAQDTNLFVATQTAVNATSPIVNLRAFSISDWQRAFVLREILGPPGGRLRH